MQNTQVDIAAVANTSRRGRGRERTQHQNVEGEPAQNDCPRGRGRKHHHVARDPARAIAQLLKKQQKAADALDSLDLDEKRRQRLIEKKAKIDEQLQELMNVKQEEPEEQEQQKEEAVQLTPGLTSELTPQQPRLTTEEPRLTPELTCELTPEPPKEAVAKPQETTEAKKPLEAVEKTEEKLLHLEDSRSHYQLALREASQKYLSLQKELKDEHLRIKNLRQIVKALKILSKAGIATECRVAVGPQQSELAEEDLAIAKQRIGEKRIAAREQARAVRELIRSHKKEQRKSGQKRHRRERKGEKGEERKKVHRKRPEKKSQKDDQNEEKRKHHKKGRKQHKAKKIRYERKTRQVNRRKHVL